MQSHAEFLGFGADRLRFPEARSVSTAQAVLANPLGRVLIKASAQPLQEVSALPPKADARRARSQVRYTPQADVLAGEHLAAPPQDPASAKAIPARAHLSRAAPYGIAAGLPAATDWLLGNKQPLAPVSSS